MTTPPDKVEILHKFERHLEVANLDVFKSGNLPQAIIPGTKEIPATFIEIIAEIGLALNKGPVPGPDDAELEYDHYAFSLTHRLITPRPAQGVYVTPPAVLEQHEDFLGRSRALMRLSRNPFNATRLPYYTVLLLNPSGCTRVFDSDLWADTAVQKYAGEMAILPAAWPGGQ
jgi:hypothetical protein